ncbi:hypothetical protein V5740_07780 [Croceibacterium sp. TMG7-5b_MA50]|uniref:hypothetical protein n=1 Tax=Croceibacterium sp. TMG7-5b_MA50 TaxID=3121290 RepID=UPI0032217C92
MKTALIPALTLALLPAACNQPADEAEAPTPALTSAAQPTTAADGEALTAGSWRIEEAANGASAAFVTAGGAPLFRMVCRRADRAMILTRSGVDSAVTVFRVAAGGMSADVTMNPAGPEAGGDAATRAGEVEAVVDPGQPILAAFADPAATIRITAPGVAPLHLPSHSGTIRVVQACS